MLGYMYNVEGVALTDGVAYNSSEPAPLVYISAMSSADNIQLSGDHTTTLCT